MPDDLTLLLDALDRYWVHRSGDGHPDTDCPECVGTGMAIRELHRRLRQAPSPAIDGLGDAALAAAYDVGLRAAAPRLGEEAMAEGADYLLSRYAREHAVGLAAVRDEVLRVLAGPVDLEGLERLAFSMWHEDEARTIDKRIRGIAQSVAHAAVAPVALALAEYHDACGEWLLAHSGGEGDPPAAEMDRRRFAATVRIGDLALRELPAFIPAAVEAHDAEIRAHDAAEVAGLREALRDLLCYPRTVYIGWAKTRFETTVEQDVAQRWQSLLADPSPAVGRIEAVIEAARRVVAWTEADPVRLVDSEVAELVDALRAAAGGDVLRGDT